MTNLPEVQSGTIAAADRKLVYSMNRQYSTARDLPVGGLGRSATHVGVLHTTSDRTVTDQADVSGGTARAAARASTCASCGNAHWTPASDWPDRAPSTGGQYGQCP
jgi:hypothetical protein